MTPAPLPAPGERLAVPGGAPAPSMGEPTKLPTPPSGPDASYAIRVEPVVAKVGQGVRARLVVTPGPGYKMNHEYPHKVTLAALEGVAVTAPSAPTSLDDNALVFDIGVTAEKAGSHTLTGQAKFAVCTPQTCDPKKVDVALSITASE